MAAKHTDGENKKENDNLRRSTRKGRGERTTLDEHYVYSSEELSTDDDEAIYVQSRPTTQKRKREKEHGAWEPEAEKQGPPAKRKLGRPKGSKSKKSRVKRQLNCGNFPDAKSNERNIRVVALGSGQEVGRSCILLSLNEYNILLDCGMHPGRSAIKEKFPRFERLHELTNSSRDKTLTEVSLKLNPNLKV